MKLGMLLVSVGVLWAVLGSVVLGPGVLFYPLAWVAVFAVLYGVHKLADTRKNKTSAALSNSEKPSGDLSHADLSRDPNAAMIR